MKIRKVRNEPLRRNAEGVQVDGAINAVIAVDVNEADSKTHVSSRQRIVQRNGRTEVCEQEHSFEQPGGPDHRETQETEEERDG